jgi:serine/threonine protein kinase
VKYIMFHVVMGLKFLHDNGILHRSLSASCIGIDEDYEVKVKDWGRETFIEPVIPESEQD